MTSLEPTAARTRKALVALVATILIAATGLLWFLVSPVGAAIIGVSGAVAIAFWYHAFLAVPETPAGILAPYLVAVAGFELHLMEEYVGHYAPAISRLFDLGWTDQGFVLVSFAMAAGLSLVAVGLHRRVRIAGFVALLFLVSRLAELLLFVFPLIPPALAPADPGAIAATVSSGRLIENMPIYYWRVTGTYYFPGMYTVLLAIVPALYAMYRIWPRSLRRRPDPDAG